MCKLAEAQQPGQTEGVAAVGLDTFGGRLGDPRGRGHQARNLRCRAGRGPGRSRWDPPRKRRRPPRPAAAATRRTLQSARALRAAHLAGHTVKQAGGDRPCVHVETDERKLTHDNEILRPRTQPSANAERDRCSSSTASSPAPRPLGSWDQLASPLSSRRVARRPQGLSKRRHYHALRRQAHSGRPTGGRTPLRCSVPPRCSDSRRNASLLGVGAFLRFRQGRGRRCPLPGPGAAAGSGRPQ